MKKERKDSILSIHSSVLVPESVLTGFKAFLTMYRAVRLSMCMYLQTPVSMSLRPDGEIAHSCKSTSGRSKAFSSRSGVHILYIA